MSRYDLSLEMAGPEHGAELSAFFRKFPVGGPVDIRIDRSDDFFAAYRIQSDQTLTYTLREPQTRELQGTASFTVLDSLIDGRETRVAFGRDLRILQTRQAVLGWTRHFLPVMEEVRRVFAADHFFSIMNMNEMKAMNAFIRPRPGRRPLPRYFLHRRFNLVSLHGRFPGAPKPLSTLRIRRGSAHLEDALINYIIQKSRERDLAVTIDGDGVRQALARWTNLKLEDFFVALDVADNIVGCCAPWSAAGIEEFIPLRYSLVGHNFRQFLKFGHLLGWTRKLTKPLHRLQVEASLDFRYLTFLFADNSDIFESLAWIAYEESRDTEFLVYAQMRSDLHLRPPLTWISARQPYGLYSLIEPDRERPAYLHPSYDRGAVIEPFFV